MARHNALLNRLSAVETLGATTVIFTDKTGTLTENRMSVSRLALAVRGADSPDIEVNFKADAVEFVQQGKGVQVSDHQGLREALEIGVLCNNAGLVAAQPDKGWTAVGDPLEVALLQVGSETGMERSTLLESVPEVREEAFDQQIKMMATFHQEDNRHRVAVKGAPEAVIEACAHLRTEDGSRDMDEREKEKWLQKNDELAQEGLRVLGLAAKEVDSKKAQPYDNLVFLGLVGLLDPPRKDVPAAMASCREAGIRAIMVTGDQAVTARKVGRSVGLIENKDPVVVQGKELQSPEELSEEQKSFFLGADIFARVSPKQKLDLIELHQRNGAVVAMTGDGVNDAPALKKADIGVAMGQRGTQVAREAADMVLKDDAFATIVVAVEQGRAIFENIRKFILFLLSGNVGEIMIVACALLIGAPLPILPLQILYLNMIGDVFPALALGVGKGDPGKISQAPRDPGEPILTGFHWYVIFSYGFVIGVAVLGSFALALDWLHMETSHAVTIAFLTLAFARLWHVFNMRDPESNMIWNDVTRNPFVWGALAICIGLLLIGVYLPVLSGVLDLVNPGATGWSLIITASMVPLLVGQLVKVRPMRKLARGN
jgi:Ca2+-transporting ATPase